MFRAAELDPPALCSSAAVKTRPGLPAGLIYSPCRAVVVVVVVVVVVFVGSKRLIRTSRASVRINLCQSAVRSTF